jgi:hypothetical protein
MTDGEALSNDLSELHDDDPNRNVILCVENERAQKMAIKGIAEKSFPGFQVETAESNEEALEKISGDLRGRIALVFVSSKMGFTADGVGLAVDLRVCAKKDVLQEMKYVPIVISSIDESHLKPEIIKRNALELFFDGGIIDTYIAQPLGIENIQEGATSAIDRVWDRIAEDAEAYKNS